MSRFRFAIISVCFCARAWGYGAGVSGYSGKPPSASCNECHSGGQGPQSVKLTGPTTLMAGEQASYTLDVVTQASTDSVGFDVAASAGKIGVIGGQPNKSYLDGGELTHTKDWPKGATVQVMFSLTAPASPGPLTLYANALDSDGVDNTGGDAARGATLEVMVEGGAPLDLFGAPPVDLSVVDAVSSATTVKPTPTLDLGPPRNEARWACDCQLASAATPSPGALVTLVPLPLLALRRRRENRRPRRR